MRNMCKCMNFRMRSSVTVADRCGGLCSDLIVPVYLAIKPYNYTVSALLGFCVSSKVVSDKKTDLVKGVACDCGLRTIYDETQNTNADKNSSQKHTC